MRSVRTGLGHITGVPSVTTGSQFVEGVGYTTDPGSCNEFLQCFYEGAELVRVENARCPFRMFWDQKILLCRPSDVASCWRDPCFDYTVQAYAHGGSCRAYWTCEGGLSQPRCCPPGLAFSKSGVCVQNHSCADPCDDDNTLSRASHVEECRLSPLETNDHFFFEEISGLGLMVRVCPRGSTFDPDQCACDRSTPPPKSRCEPELVLDFEDGISDKSRHNVAILAQDVVLENGTAYFNGNNSRITIWRFASLSFGDEFTLTMNYREVRNARSSQTMHIVSNCCCGGHGGHGGPSVDVAVVPSEAGGTVRLLGETWVDKSTVNITYQAISAHGLVHSRSAAVTQTQDSLDGLTRQV
ncbi:hypothetical protein ScPMuIL_005691 [Solemya velum]